MNNKELQASRKLLMLDVSEAAEDIGKVSPRTWQYWESGRNAVPADVEREMLDLLSQRTEMMKPLDAALERGERPAIAFHQRYEDFRRANCRGSLVEWRLSQSVAALYFAQGYVDLQ